MRNKLLAIGIVLTALSTAVKAQTLNVVTEGVTYQFPATEAGNMEYSEGGTKLTVEGRTFAVADIVRIYVDETPASKNTVSVGYDGGTAAVSVSGNVARYISATVSGAHVSISQTNTADVDGDEITYTLSGTTTDGEFSLAGSYKCTVQLNGVTLTNPAGAAINIQNGKRIQLSAKKGTTNTLTDGTGGSQKACIYSKGQIQLQGNGTLNVAGNTSHAIKSGDYIAVKNLTLNVTSAVGDGISCNEYFLMESGTVTISGVGDDGIQCDLDGDTSTGETEGHDDEDSGNIYIDGGTLSLTTTANGAKALKSDSTVVVNAGTVTINAKGGVDTTDSSDPSYVAGISAGKFVQNGGAVTMTIQGTSGRGVKAYDVETNGGELTITNSAAPATISSDVKGAKGIKALNCALNAGTITITMSGNASKAIRCGDGTQSTSGGGGGGWGGSGGGWGGGHGGGGMGRRHHVEQHQGQLHPGQGRRHWPHADHLADGRHQQLVVGQGHQGHLRRHHLRRRDHRQHHQERRRGLGVEDRHRYSRRPALPAMLRRLHQLEGQDNVQRRCHRLLLQRQRCRRLECRHRRSHHHRQRQRAGLHVERRCRRGIRLRQQLVHTDYRHGHRHQRRRRTGRRRWQQHHLERQAGLHVRYQQSEL